MAQYDGSIRINTQINVKSAEAQLGALENKIIKSADKIDSLRSKMDLSNAIKLPTQEYKEIQEQIAKTESKLAALLDRQEKFLQTGGSQASSAYKKMQYDVEELRNSLSYLKGEEQDLISTGKAFTIGDPAQTEKLSQQLKAEEANLDAMMQKRDLLNSKIQAQEEEERRLSDIKENATVADQKMVDLMERRRQLLAQIRDMEKAGVTEGYAEYDTALADLSDVQGQINGIRNMKDAAAEARSSYIGLGETVKTTFKTMARGMVDIPVAAVKAGVRGLVSGFQKLGSVVKNVAINAFHKLGAAIKTSLSKAGSLIGNMVSKLKTLGSTSKKSFGDVNKSAKKTGGTLGNLASRFKGIMLSFLIFNQITKVLNGAVKAIKDGFGNLYKDNERFQNSVDELKASVLTLKNAFAAAFRPLVDIAIPYIQMAADKLTELLTKVGQFTAAITGQKTYTKAIKQTADAFKDAKKAAEGYLSPLDEINKYSSGKSEDEDENQYGQMFEELPVEQKFLDMANKVKDVFEDIFSPIKEAWGKEGQFVIDSWKYGLDEVWKLIKDIGRDLLTVWKQPATVAMLQDILHIFGDIGLIVGNLAAKFREAWNQNDVGLHILENIRDIFAAIIHNIREAAYYTVEWTKTLDFTPLLQGIERLTASLVPFFDFLSGTLADFYTEFILPLISWSLSEEGIPRLLNVLADFMESVDWESLRDALKNLYGALEPYAEAVGTGLIDFIERMKEYGVEFLNFLPEHINAAADALRSGDLKTAFEEFGTITGEAVKTAFNFIKESIESINWGEIGTLIASFINGIDWQGVGDAFFGSITAVINAAIDLVYNFITTTDWRSLGESLGTSLSDALMSIDWAQAGQTVGEAFKAFFNFLAETIENIDWYELGQKVREFLVNIDWAGVAEAFFEAIGAAFGGFGAFLWGFLGDNLIEGPGLKYFIEKIKDTGLQGVEGFKQGILDGFSGIWNWIKEHMIDPFLDGFRKGFGIHSPSTVMAEMGRYIIEGLLNGLKNMWNSITSWIEDKVDWIIDKFQSVKDKVSGFFSGGGSGESGQSYSARLYSARALQTSYIPAPIAQTLRNAEIPGYATGQVIPASMKKHLAWLGDNDHETEVVSPLSTIRQAQKEALVEALSDLGLTGLSGNNDIPPIILKLILDSKVVYEAVIKEGKVRQMSTGSNDFALGTT